MSGVVNVWVVNVLQSAWSYWVNVMFLSFPGLLILSGFRRGLNLFIYIIKESSQRRFVLVFFLVDVGEQTTKKEINGDSSPRLLWAG